MKSNHPHAGADVRSFDYPSLIANFASDVILVATPDFLCVWASPSVTTALGWKPSELIGRTTTDLIHPDDAANVLARREVAGTDVVQVPRSRLRRRDGSYLWVSARAQTITSDQYAGELRVIILRDVQEEVEVEEELRLRMIDLQNTYKLLQRSQELAGIATFRIDLDREVISLSPELSEMYGAGHEGLE